MTKSKRDNYNIDAQCDQRKNTVYKQNNKPASIDQKINIVTKG